MSLKRVTPENAERWLAEQSAIHCKSERQAQFLLKLSGGSYKKLLEVELKKHGYLQENTNG
jgi:predicted nucleic-acid-binding Zn-ribbon protein